MIRAFLLGLREFRSAWTTHFEDPQARAYDQGRDLAHRLTFRRWEES